MNAKARSKAKQMENVDSAVETTLAATHEELEGEMKSFGKSKGALKIYLQEQYKSRKLLHFGNYQTISLTSEFRCRVKPYALRMTPTPKAGVKINTDMQITYLRNMLFAMIAEDLQRPLEATARAEDTQLVRRLPVISNLFLNPASLRLKTLQESRIAAMVAPKDNPWFATLTEEYLGKTLYDGGYFRVFAIQFVPNKGRNVFPCWEATTEPVYKDQDGEWVVHNRHLVVMEDGSRKLLKSAMEGFALAEYSNGDDVDPVRLPFADTCHAKFLEREARAAAKPATARKRRLSATLTTSTRPPARTRSRRSDPEIQRSSDAEIQT